MQRQILSISLFVVSFLAGPLYAQSYVLELGNVEGTFGENVGVPLTLSTDDEVQGVQAVFDWTPSTGSGVDLVLDPAFEENDFVFFHVDASWMTVGIVVDIINSAPPLTGQNIRLATAIIQCGEGPDVTETPVVFRDDLYSASSEPLPLSNVVTVGVDSVRKEDGLVLTSGSFRCGPPESYGLALGAAEGQLGGTVEVPLSLSTDAEVEGVQAVFEWDGSAGVGVELVIDPAVDADADFVFSHVDADWMTLGVTSVMNPLTGTNVPLATAVIRCGSGPEPTETPIVFVDEVHSAPESPLPLSNAVTVRGRSRLAEDGLELTNGSFICSGPEICDDAVDNDGDGLVDCEDSDCGSGVEVTPPELQFGDVPVGGSSELEATVANPGACDLTVLGLELTPDSSSAFSVAGSGEAAVVPPGESLTTVVTFSPGSGGAASGTLRISTDNADTPTVEVVLGGNGTEPSGVPQIAGDCNQDGSRNLADVVCMVKLLFPGFVLLDRSVEVPPCSTDEGTVAVLDLNGDSTLNGSDVVLLADFLFTGGAPPAQGVDCFAVAEGLGCSQNGACP